MIYQDSSFDRSSRPRSLCGTFYLDNLCHAGTRLSAGLLITALPCQGSQLPTPAKSYAITPDTHAGALPEGLRHARQRQQQETYYTSNNRCKAWPRGGAEKKWCSVHKSTTHSNADCLQQGAPSLAAGASHTANALRAICSTSTGGFMSMPLSGGRTYTVLPHRGGITSYWWTVAQYTEHFVDDELVPDLMGGKCSTTTPFSRRKRR